MSKKRNDKKIINKMEKGQLLKMEINIMQKNENGQKILFLKQMKMNE